MLRYVIKRVLLVIPTLLGAAALVFVLMRLIPGDVCVMRLGSSGGTFDPKAIALCHAELGMERPLLIQFIDFVWGCMRLDFGTSMWSGQPVTTEIMARLPISVEIAILATVVAIAIPLGTISAVKQNTWIDYAVRVFERNAPLLSAHKADTSSIPVEASNTGRWLPKATKRGHRANWVKTKCPGWKRINSELIRCLRARAGRPGQS